MEETKDVLGPRLAISQFHNTIPFYNGDFQFLESNLEKLEKLDEDYFEFDYQHGPRQQFEDKTNLKSTNNLGEI